MEGSLQQSPVQPVQPSLSLMGNMCGCLRLCGTARGSFTLSLFRRRGRQNEWMQCIENFAYLHHVHDTISIYACQRVSQTKQLIAMNSTQYAPVSGWSGVVSIPFPPGVGGDRQGEGGVKHNIFGNCLCIRIS